MWVSLLAENEICRGASYMRPRRFILSQVGTGGYGIRPLWLGIMKIGEKAGVVNVLSRALSPVFTRLFPDIPKNHPVMGSIFMNIASNMLGLDNAATPTG